MNKLFVILPCYNEEENIICLVERWKSQEEMLKEKVIDAMEIVVVDDGSTDATGKVLKTQIEDSSNIRIIHHLHNRGLGQAIKTGIKYTMERCDEGDYVCTMDADNTHSPSYIYSMLHQMEISQADCIIASRYHSGSRTTGVSAMRLAMSLGARVYYSLLMRIVNVKDYTCGYRLYRAEMLQKAYREYGDDFISQQGFVCMVELLYKIYRVGAKFEEVPFELRYDLKKGNSKMRVLRNAFGSLYAGFQLKRDLQYSHLKGS